MEWSSPATGAPVPAEPVPSLQVPATGPAPAPPADRRAAARPQASAGVGVEVRLGALGRGPDLAVGLVDVSEAGARVLLRGPVQPGEEVGAVFTRAAGGPAIAAQAEVRWCVPARDGTYRVGLRFRHRLSRRDVLDLAR